jgi:hypothetical protein
MAMFSSLAFIILSDFLMQALVLEPELPEDLNQVTDQQLAAAKQVRRP